MLCVWDVGVVSGSVDDFQEMSISVICGEGIHLLLENSSDRQGVVCWLRGK